MALDTKISILSIYDILPNRYQPRIKFGEEKINELAESIRKYGVIQPIIVRSIGDKYEIIAGERRYKASILAGLKEIPAIINNLDDKDSSEIALIENVQRENLTPIEEAISIKKILDMGSKTQEQLAEKLGMSQPALANKLRLLQLDETVQEALLEKKISERHARSLLKIHNTDEQKTMLNRIINERLTVRKVDEEIQKMIQHQPEIKKDISTFLPKIENDEKEDTKPKDLFEDKELKMLDILNDYYKENKEERNMNSNDPMNQFTVPGIVKENNNMSEIETMNQSINQQPSLTSVNENVTLTHTAEPVPSINRLENQNNLDKKEESLVGNYNAVKENETNSPILKKPEGKFFDVLPSRENIMEKPEVEKDTNSSISNLMEDNIFADANAIPVPFSTQTTEKTAETKSSTSPTSFQDISYLSENLIHRKEDTQSPTIPASSAMVLEEKMQPVKEEKKIELNSIVKEPISPSNEEAPLPSMAKETNKEVLSYSMREAINEVRNVAEQIESIGISVDTEEMDSKDYYEIVIHLMKGE